MIKGQSAQPLGVVLAGGQSRRMGGPDKSLALLAGRPLVAHVIARIAPQVGGLAINANGDPARFAGLGLPVIADSLAGHPGPLAGVLAALDWAAAEGADKVVTVSVDTPFLPRDLVARLAAVGGLALARSADGWQPTCGLWPVALRDDLRAAVTGGMRKVTDWALAEGAQAVRFEDPNAFFNINTPDDLARAQRMAEGA